MTGGWARLDGRDNALNAVRLVLAGIVLLKHSTEALHGIGGPLPYVASFAVDGFFAISGFLIAGSRARLTFRDFLLRRALRILPGLWVAMLVIAFVFAPIAAAVQGQTMAWGDAIAYVLNNGALRMSRFDIGDTLAGNPLWGWNASIWTLPYEVFAYVMFGAVLTAHRFGRRCSAALCGVLAAANFAQAATGGTALRVDESTLRLMSFFAAGVALWFWRDRLSCNGWIAAWSAAVIVGTATQSTPLYWAFSPLPVAYLMLWLGVRLPTRVGSRNDLSYGVYVYAWPVTQLLIVLGVPAPLGDAGFVLAVVVCTLPLAAASWLWVERLRWRSSGVSHAPPPGRPPERDKGRGFLISADAPHVNERQPHVPR